MLWISLDENIEEEQNTAIPGEDGRAAGGKRQQRRCGQHATQFNTSAHHWRLVLSTHSADQRLLQRGASAGHNTLELGPGEWHKLSLTHSSSSSPPSPFNIELLSFNTLNLLKLTQINTYNSQNCVLH